MASPALVSQGDDHNHPHKLGKRGHKCGRCQTWPYNWQVLYLTWSSSSICYSCPNYSLQPFIMGLISFYTSG